MKNVSEEQRMILYECPYNKELILYAKMFCPKLKTMYRNQLVFNASNGQQKCIQMFSMRMKDHVTDV